MWKRLVTTLAALTAAAVGTAAPVVPGTARADGASTCRHVDLPVSLAAGRPADRTVSGRLCTPGPGARTIDVLVHGFAYNSSYWDFPVDRPRYSYVHRTWAAGRATFTYDAVGAGASSHPLSTELDADAEAFVLHQVLDWLHGLHAFPKVNVIGHSAGSMTAVMESAAYHDEDALVLTGFTHAVNPVHIAEAVADLYPAQFDEQFADRGLDAGYLTTVPGTRGTLFHSDRADPAVVAHDEAHKDVVSATYFGGAIAANTLPPATNPARNVTAPVLEVIGRQDFLYCGTGQVVDCADSATVRSFDRPYFPNAASLTVFTVPGTGHSLALHPSGPRSFAAIDDWLTTH
ncbi:alpha/beta hydrolase [Streptomyces sp. NPDC055210]